MKASFQSLRDLGISHAIAQKYIKGKKQAVLLEHIKAICLFLHCAPYDLFELLPDNALQDDKHQPLQKIKPKKPFVLVAVSYRNCSYLP